MTQSEKSPRITDMTLEDARHQLAADVLQRLSYKIGDDHTNWTHNDVRDIESAFVAATAYTTYWLDLVQAAHDITDMMRVCKYHDERDRAQLHHTMHRIRKFMSKNKIPTS